ncbi:MAG: dihydropteroate synthase [Mariprofundaceae bacterium]
MRQSRWHRPVSGSAWIMGVLNCTPDSFSDGGKYADADTAIQHGLAMRDAGASLIDVGGESTRPGSEPVSLQEELSRVVPVVKALSAAGCSVSIDTTKAEVIRQAVQAGAVVVNDVTALQGDPDALAAVADLGTDVCLMHMQGTPETMQDNPHYGDVVREVMGFFEQRITACSQAGIVESAILLDPGIGFGKRLEDNLALITHIADFKRVFGMPVLLGVSRKSFLGMITGSSVEDREIETAAAVSACICNGADVLRVHDVSAQIKAVQVASALYAQTGDVVTA